MPPQNLRIPGPTPLPDHIRSAVAAPMINHRGADFAELLTEVRGGVKAVFDTSGDVILLGSSGTGAMEAAATNFFSPGDPVLVVRGGVFADRAVALTTAFGLDAEVLDVEWGRAVDPTDIVGRLDAGGHRGLFLTHNETSTGVTTDLAAVGTALGDRDVLFVVDAVSSAAAIPIRADHCRLDIVYSASQKAWMAPPGLAMIAVSPRAWRFQETARLPRFYFDLKSLNEQANAGRYPWTPSLPALFALRVALREFLDEGLFSVYSRHEHTARYVRERIHALGLDLFPEESVASDTVTAVLLPAEISAVTFRELALRDHDTVFGGGLAHLAEFVFRIGHLGWLDRDAIDRSLDVVAAVLESLGDS
ncbi:MAG: alanine--glyoxylate aminotransferase family protein [Chloroflexota bacterium]|nr:alanine--glyoxylate aminotransferase family protein [Chloroflexota bacterium]MDP6508697.1 alanine--glyoxylate aminotransferase family protein [Chloroflexota bacterium]